MLMKRYQHVICHIAKRFRDEGEPNWEQMRVKDFWVYWMEGGVTG